MPRSPVICSREVERFTRKFGKPHEPLNKPREIVFPVEKIRGIVTVREDFEARRLAPKNKKPQEGGFPLGRRRVPEISIAGRKTGHQGAPGSARGVGRARRRKRILLLESRGNPLEALEAQQSPWQPLRGEISARARGEGREKTPEHLPSLSESVSRAVCSAPANARTCHRVCGTRSVPRPTRSPAGRTPPRRRQPREIGGEQATMSPSSGATIRRSPTKKPRKGPGRPRKPDVPERTRLDAPYRHPQHGGAQDRPVPPHASSSVGPSPPSRSRAISPSGTRKRTVNPSPARPETSPSRTANAGAPAGETIRVSPSRRHWASTLRPARTRRQVRAIASLDLLPALRAELGAGGDLRAALRAFGLGRQRGAALRANLPPFASAPHFGQCTTIVASKFTPSVWSRARSFSVACSTAISACLAAISRWRIGAHLVHSCVRRSSRFRGRPTGRSVCTERTAVDLGDRFGERTVVGRAADGLLNLVGAGGGAPEDAAEDAPAPRRTLPAMPTVFGFQLEI